MGLVGKGVLMDGECHGVGGAKERREGRESRKIGVMDRSLCRGFRYRRCDIWYGLWVEIRRLEGGVAVGGLGGGGWIGSGGGGEGWVNRGREGVVVD